MSHVRRSATDFTAPTIPPIVLAVRRGYHIVPQPARRRLSRNVVSNYPSVVAPLSLYVHNFLDNQPLSCYSNITMKGNPLSDLKDKTLSTWDELHASSGIPVMTLRYIAARKPEELTGTSLKTIFLLEKKLNVNLYDYVKFNLYNRE